MPDRNIKVVQESTGSSSRALFTTVPEVGEEKETIFDAKAANHSSHNGTKCKDGTATSSGSESTARTDDNLNIVYDSEKDQAPYPDGEYIRTPSPEHTGIPAGSRGRGAAVLPRSRDSACSYTSDEGCDALTMERTVQQQQRRSSANPAGRRKFKNGVK